MRFPNSLAALVLAVSPLFGPSNQQERLCNGEAALCDRKYSDVSFIGAHDSPFDGQGVSDSQELPVEQQLSAGIRWLQGQVHDNSGVLHMCRTNCALRDAGTLQTYLGKIKTFLDNNPREVITLLLVNGDRNNVTQWGTDFEAAGLSQYAFIPSQDPLPKDSWPTLEDLICGGTRLITAIDVGADTSLVSYILDEQSYWASTPYQISQPEDFRQCNISQPNTKFPINESMYLMNHFRYAQVGNLDIFIPNKAAALETNAATGNYSIGEQADICNSTFGRFPNVALVDFYDLGNVFAAQKALNDL